MRLVTSFSVSAVILAMTATATADCPELVSNGDFSSGLAGWSIDNPGGYASLYYLVTADPYTPGNDFLYLDIGAYTGYAWQSDVEMDRGVSLVAGNWYRLSFWARAGASNTSVPVHVKIGETSDPYDPVGLDEDVSFIYASGEGSTHELEFQATATGDFGLVFLMGLETAELWIDGVSLVDLSSPDCATGGGGGTGGSSGGSGGFGASGGSGGTGGGSTGGSGAGGSGGQSGAGGLISHNQLGYVSGAEKVATLRESSGSPVSWQLLDDQGAVVDSGQTNVSGNDAPSGFHVHLIDFSDYEGSGSGYRLQTPGAMSAPFAIGTGVYAGLRRDALRFFYHQRASVALVQPFAEGSAYVRAAGHTDSSVTCFDGSCSYFLDTRGGWYDAGDYGKYVVNGGIALWTLQNLYERTQYLGTDLSALGDGANNIPESDNGRSDLLDEAEIEIRFLLRMQVPDGENLAGMAHHKVHADEWDTIPVTPASALPHLLHRPSTAATLNLAATAAQCARIFEVHDSDLADACLVAAEKAYAAAKDNPGRLASKTDTEGGGAYDDGDVSDEFYWAAAELFVTTGNASYAVDLFDSEHHAAPPEGAPFSWPTTATLGMLSLATVPNGLSAGEVEAIRAALVLRAEADLPLAQAGYGAITDGYYWGSNSVVLNSGLLQAVAYDLTGSAEHRGAALAALDYVLGRNPLNQSYVSGYGGSPFENAHHRFWANAFDSGWPKPPKGVLAGGPNENLDGLSTAVISNLGLTGCAPSRCFSDYENGYSMTEVTINWNAPLAWLASWASEQETDPQTEFPGVDLSAKPGSGPMLGSGGSSSGGASGSGGAGGDSSASGGSGATSAGSTGSGGRDEPGSSGGKSSGNGGGSSGRGGGEGDGGSDLGEAGAGADPDEDNVPSGAGGCAYSAPRPGRFWGVGLGLLVCFSRRRTRRGLLDRSAQQSPST